MERCERSDRADRVRTARMVRSRMINNALPDALEDDNHELKWHAGSPVRGRTAWSDRPRQIAAQVAAWFRTRVARQLPAEAERTPRQLQAAELPPEDPPPPPRGEPPQWPTRLLEVQPAPVVATDAAPPTPDAPASAPAPAASAKPPRRRHVIVTLPPPDFEAGADYDPLPPPQGFCRETVLLDEAAALAGRLRVLRKLPKPVALPRVEPEEEPLVMLLPPPAHAAERAKAEPLALRTQVPPVPQPRESSPAAAPVASHAHQPPAQQARERSGPTVPQSHEPSVTREVAPAPVAAPVLPPSPPVRVPVKRTIVTLTRPAPEFVATCPAPAVAVERPVPANSIDDGWVGRAADALVDEIPVCDAPDRADRRPAAREDDVADANVAEEDTVCPSDAAHTTDATEPAEVADAPVAIAIDATDATDAALLLPAGDPEPEIRFDIAADEEAAYESVSALEALEQNVEEDCDPLTFDVVDETPIDFGIETAKAATSMEGELLPVPRTMPAPPLEIREDVAPPVEIAAVVDITSDPSPDPVIEWSGETGAAEELVCPPVMVDAPQEESAPAAAVEASLVAVAEPAEPLAPAREAARPTVPLKTVLRRVVYVQDGAVLPLSARRVRAAMARVRPLRRHESLPAAARRPVPAGAAPSSEASHDDGL